MGSEHTWAVVLAGGEGRRLRGLTTTAGGVAIPKQYCSLFGGTSLLEQALVRAQAVAAPERICAVVAEQHGRWWPDHVSSIPPENVIVQPNSRGTAIGILLSLLEIVQQDPNARIVVLPSDHFVGDEPGLARWLRVAERSSARSQRILLLGFEPVAADPELGYILTRHAIGSRQWRVAAFVEKPPLARAQQLQRRGALWNAFIIAASAAALLGLYKRAIPEVLDRMSEAVDAGAQGDRAALGRLYERLPDIDFSRDLLATSELELDVLAVPHVGWSDLGTPERLQAVIRDSRCASRAPPAGAQYRSRLSLAAQSALKGATFERSDVGTAG